MHCLGSILTERGDDNPKYVGSSENGTIKNLFNVTFSDKNDRHLITIAWGERARGNATGIVPNDAYETPAFAVDDRRKLTSIQKYV